MDKEVFISRRSKVMEQVEPNSLVIIRGSAKLHIYSGNYRPFRQNSNFLYLTGINEPNLVLFILKTPSQVSEFIFIERPDKLTERWERKIPSKEEISEMCGVNTAHYLDEVNKVSDRLLPSAENIYIDEDFNNNIYNKDLQNDIVMNIKRLYPTKTFFDIKNIISPFRLIKEICEIDSIKKAIETTRKALDEVRSILRDGITENEILGHILKVFLYNNSYPSFSPIVGTGPSSNCLHYDKNNRKSLKNETVLIDIGSEHEFYSSDITRTFPISGRFTDFQRETYQMVLEVQEYAFSIARPGISLFDLNKKVRDFQRSLYLKNKYAETDKEAELLIAHNISHYLGLDPHDFGDFNAILQPDMVITIEPGIYMEDKGFGIRIEDDILITEEGNINLSAGIAKKLKEIES